MSLLNHPLPIGTKILSVRGETDEDEDGNLRDTGPNAVGEVISADQYTYGVSPQGWCYGVQFPNGVCVFIDQLNSIDDENLYRILGSDST